MMINEMTRQAFHFLENKISHYLTWGVTATGAGIGAVKTAEKSGFAIDSWTSILTLVSIAWILIQIFLALHKFHKSRKDKNNKK